MNVGATKIWKERKTQVSHEETVADIKRALKSEEVAGYRLGALMGDHAKCVSVLEGWLRRIVACETGTQEVVCPVGHRYEVRRECHVPCCPYEESLKLKLWGRIARGLVVKLPPGREWRIARAYLEAMDVKLPAKQPQPQDVMIWIALDLGLRDTGDLVADINRALALRPKAWRKLSSLGCVAGYLVLDVGLENGHPHLHALVYGPKLPIEELRKWLRARDCDTADCTHEDRSCRGSSAIGIKRAYSEWEAVKYFLRLEATKEEWQSKSSLRLATYLAMYGRRRVERYGLARPSFGVAEYQSNADGVFCPICNKVHLGAFSIKNDDPDVMG